MVPKTFLITPYHSLSVYLSWYGSYTMHDTSTDLWIRSDWIWHLELQMRSANVWDMTKADTKFFMKNRTSQSVNLSRLVLPMGSSEHGQEGGKSTAASSSKSVFIYDASYWTLVLNLRISTSTVTCNFVLMVADDPVHQPHHKWFSQTAPRSSVVWFSQTISTPSCMTFCTCMIWQLCTAPFPSSMSLQMLTTLPWKSILSLSLTFTLLDPMVMTWIFPIPVCTCLQKPPPSALSHMIIQSGYTTLSHIPPHPPHSLLLTSSSPFRKTVLEFCRASSHSSRLFARSLHTLILQNYFPALLFSPSALPVLWAISAPFFAITSLCSSHNIVKLDIPDEAVLTSHYKAFVEVHSDLSMVQEFSLFIGDWDNELMLAIIAHFPNYTSGMQGEGQARWVTFPSFSFSFYWCWLSFSGYHNWHGLMYTVCSSTFCIHTHLLHHSTPTLSKFPQDKQPYDTAWEGAEGDVVEVLQMLPHAVLWPPARHGTQAASKPCYQNFDWVRPALFLRFRAAWTFANDWCVMQHLQGLPV